MRVVDHLIQMRRALNIESTDDERAHHLGHPVEDVKAARRGRVRVSGLLQEQVATVAGAFQRPVRQTHHISKRQAWR